MQVLLEIPDEALPKLQAVIRAEHGFCYDPTQTIVQVFSLEDAMLALKEEGLSEGMLDGSLKEPAKVLLDGLSLRYKRGQGISDEIFQSYAKAVVIDFIERKDRQQKLSKEASNYAYLSLLYQLGIRPIAFHKPELVNGIRARILEFFRVLSMALEEYLENDSYEKDSAELLFLALDTILYYDIRLDLRLDVSSTSDTPHKTLKAALYPTIMPFHFEDQDEYFLAATAGYESLQTFLLTLYPLAERLFIAQEFESVKDTIRLARKELHQAPFGGKAAELILHPEERK